MTSLAWLLIGLAIGLFFVLLSVVIYVAGGVLNLVIWLLGQIGVLLIRFVGWSACRIRDLVYRIRDTR